MSRPRFLADHDLNEHIVTGVLRREPAVEFVRARDLGMSEHPDAEVLAYAADHGFIVVSHNVNTMPSTAYARISASQKMSGLLMVKQSDTVSNDHLLSDHDLVRERGRRVGTSGVLSSISLNQQMP
jgi:hypothetical protein